MPRSAATRIALTGSLAFALAIGVLGAAAYLLVDRALRTQLDDRVAAEVSSLVSEYRGEGEAGLKQVIAHREVARATNDLGYGLFDGSGRRIAGALASDRPKAGWQTLLFYDPAERHREPGRALAVDIAPGRRLVVAADSDAVHDADRLMLELLGGALGATVIIGTLGAVLLAGYLRRRLAAMAEGAETIAGGDLSRRMPIGSRGDEFDRLASALNAMLDRIAILLDNLRQVSGDVAHDLRQPLTRLRNQLDRALAGPDAKMETERAIAQVDGVLALFSSLLRLSEIEAGRVRESFGPVDLAKLATELGESYTPAAEDQGRLFRVAAAETPVIDGDLELLAQAATNLLDNALIHTPVGSTIRLATENLPNRLTLSVTDDGPGVPEADLPRITQRFVRLEPSRNRPGNGLGLAIVAAIARLHGGRLVLGDNYPGLIATIEIPR